MSVLLLLAAALTLSGARVVWAAPADESAGVWPSSPYVRQETSPAGDAPTPDSRPVVLAEDFNNPAAHPFGCPLLVPGRLETACDNGEYVIRSMATPGLQYGITLGERDDVTVSVDVRFADTSDGQYFGIDCRDQQPANVSASRPGYRFEVLPATSDFVLSRSDGARPIALAHGPAPEAINSGDQVNHLELSCIGDTITARANGHELASVDGGAYHGGRIWLVVGNSASQSPVAEARMDNLVVYGP
jgi:hypothetical protein